MTVIDLCQVFSTDDKCRELLERLRWPNGAECLRCKGKGVVRLSTNAKVFWCAECDYQFSILSNTIFHDTHLPLIKWFTATYLLCESRKGMSANQIKRTLGITYKTSWYLCHRIRAAMATTERAMLDGTIEIDETYVGGKFRCTPTNRKFTDNKEVVIGIRKRNGELRFIHAKNAKAKTVKAIIGEHVSEDVDVIVTDDAVIYNFALNKEQKKKHETVNHSAKEYVRLGTDIHTNTVESAFSLLKRGIIGTWHRVSAKHLQAYLDEMTFRFDRRKRSDLFLDTLRHMVTADPLTFEKLTA